MATFYDIWTFYIHITYLVIWCKNTELKNMDAIYSKIAEIEFSIHRLLYIYIYDSHCFVLFCHNHVFTKTQFHFFWSGWGLCKKCKIISIIFVLYVLIITHFKTKYVYIFPGIMSTFFAYGGTNLRIS